MRLLLAAGIVAIPTVEEVQASEVAWRRLVVEAVRFLRVGALTLSDWERMTTVEREALGDAAEIVASERAALTGLASQSTEAAMRVGARSDGGASLAEALVQRAAADIAARAPGEPSVPVEPSP